MNLEDYEDEDYCDERAVLTEEQEWEEQDRRDRNRDMEAFLRTGI